MWKLIFISKPFYTHRISNFPFWFPDCSEKSRKINPGSKFWFWSQNPGNRLSDFRSRGAFNKCIFWLEICKFRVFSFFWPTNSRGFSENSHFRFCCGKTALRLIIGTFFGGRSLETWLLWGFFGHFPLVPEFNTFWIL